MSGMPKIINEPQGLNFNRKTRSAIVARARPRFIALAEAARARRLEAIASQPDDAEDEVSAGSSSDRVEEAQDSTETTEESGRDVRAPSSSIEDDFTNREFHGGETRDL